MSKMIGQWPDAIGTWLQAAVERRHAEELQRDRDRVLAGMVKPPACRRWFTFGRPLPEPPRISLPVDGAALWENPKPADPIADLRALMETQRAPTQSETERSMLDWLVKQRLITPEDRGAAEAPAYVWRDGPPPSLRGGLLMGCLAEEKSR